MKDFERSGEDNVRQQDIVERLVRMLEVEQQDRQTSVEKALETTKKVAHVIQYLITNENILMVSQDAKVKNDRYLTMSMNVDMENVAGMLQGNTEPNY
jgi:hypothetical protein